MAIKGARKAPTFVGAIDRPDNIRDVEVKTVEYPNHIIFAWKACDKATVNHENRIIIFSKKLADGCIVVRQFPLDKFIISFTDYSNYQG